jgi:hypothetical protein
MEIMWKKSLCDKKIVTITYQKLIICAIHRIFYGAIKWENMIGGIVEL